MIAIAFARTWLVTFQKRTGGVFMSNSALQIIATAEPAPEASVKRAGTAVPQDQMAASSETIFESERPLADDPAANTASASRQGIWWAVAIVAMFLLVRIAPKVGPVPTWAVPSLAVLAKLVPLYLIVGLGIVVGRVLDLDRATIGSILVRAVSPVVFFGAVASAPITPRDLVLPALFLCIPTMICLLSLCLTRRLLPAPEARLAAFLAGSANVGYFGVPAALAVLPEHVLGLYMLCLLGFTVYENTVGYYMLARGCDGVRGSLRRVASLPALHAILLGVFVNWMSLPGSQAMNGLWGDFKSCYIVLGMLTLGLGLAHLPSGGPMLRFASVTASLRFLLWPMVAACLVIADVAAGSLVGGEVQRIILLIAALPCATSGAIFAAELGVEPEKASVSVLGTTLLALGTVPLVTVVLPLLHHLS